MSQTPPAIAAPSASAQPGVATSSAVPASTVPASTVSVSAAPPDLPSVPRPLSRAARWRSWAEMSVRVWLALALALAVVIVWLTVNQIAAGAAERELIFNGIPVDAVITQIGNISDPRLASRRIEPLVVKVRYLLPGESQERIVGGSLSRLNDPSVLVHPGDHVPLRIDPKIPWIWTDRTQPQSWLLQLSVALILLPVLLVLLVIAWLTRERVLRIWQHGELSAGIVVDVRQIAIAPRSRQVRFTLADRSSARVFSVLIPIKAGLPRPGEQIWLIQPRGLPQHALPAKMYL